MLPIDHLGVNEAEHLESQELEDGRRNPDAFAAENMNFGLPDTGTVGVRGHSGIDSLH